MLIKAGSRILVSACLLGVGCNYKEQASSAWQERPDFWRKVCVKFQVVPVCPEQLGGLPTPRVPAELQRPALEILGGSGAVLTRDGLDVTAKFLKGARETLYIAREWGVGCAILKSRSPSCGKIEVYDGTFSGRLIPGPGITAALLRREGFAVFDELEFEKAMYGTVAGCAHS